MKVIAPDFDRTVDLPEVGPTSRPVEIDQSVTGFRNLVAFRIHEYEDDAVIQGETGEDEMLLVLLAGALAVTVTGPHEAEFRLDADGDWAAYVPPHRRYRLKPLTPCAIADARARPIMGSAPRAFGPRDGILAVDEPAERLRMRLLPLSGETDAGAGLGPDLERLAHLTGPATVLGDAPHDLPPAHTLVLYPGEGARVTGEGEILTIAALPPRVDSGR